MQEILKAAGEIAEFTKDNPLDTAFQRAWWIIDRLKNGNPIVKTNCKTCGNTGLYVGFAERNGTAVVCRLCDGKGFKEITIEPFAGHKKREGISRVFVDGGLWFTRGDDETKATVSVKEFYEKFKQCQ